MDVQWVFNCVEINKTNYLFRAIYSELTITRESTTVTCVLGDTQGQTEEWETFTVEEKEGFRNALIGGNWHRVSMG